MVHLLFSQVFGSLLVLHDCPPVVLVLFDGCMIVHLLFSYVFGTLLVLSTCRSFHGLLYWNIQPFTQQKKKKKPFTVGLYCFSPWSVNPAQHLSLGLNLYSWIGVCAGQIEWVKANISIQSATNPPKSKSGGLVTNFGGFNSAGYAG